MNRLTFPALLWLSLTPLASIHALEQPDVVLARWLAAQTNLTSWSADFMQTRQLKALTHPLTTPGKVWFVAPDRFRWELGQPAQSIALRTGDELLVLSPKLKRAERYTLSAAARGPMKDALALLDTGFPRDAMEFRHRFDLLAVTETNATFALRLQPRTAAARRLMPELTVHAATNDFALTATELRFADGSRLRNDFTHALKNPALDPGLFSVPLDATWKVTEPLKPH